MIRPESGSDDFSSNFPELNFLSLHHHEQLLLKFAQLESAINAILFAGMLGTYQTNFAVEANKSTLMDAKNWLPIFNQQVHDGWLLQQKAHFFEERGLRILLEKLEPFDETLPYEPEATSAISNSELNISQFMMLLTLGMLSKMKSVNYANLNRKENLGNDPDILKRQTFWMFNWQPETVFAQLEWLSSTSHWVTKEPVDLARNYSHQLLKFGHFVSAFIVTGQDRATSIHRAFKRKALNEEVTNVGRNTVIIPAGSTISPPPEVDSQGNDQRIYNASESNTVPDEYSDFINGLNL